MAGGAGYGAAQMVQSPMEELSEQATHLREEADKNVLLATLGGVAPALVAPLTKGPNVEKVCADHFCASPGECRGGMVDVIGSGDGSSLGVITGRPRGTGG
jgi:hypothetical protein